MSHGEYDWRSASVKTLLAGNRLGKLFEVFNTGVRPDNRFPDNSPRSRILRTASDPAFADRSIRAHLRPRGLFDNRHSRTTTEQIEDHISLIGTGRYRPIQESERLLRRITDVLLGLSCWYCVSVSHCLHPPGYQQGGWLRTRRRRRLARWRSWSRTARARSGRSFRTRGSRSRASSTWRSARA